MRIGSVKLVNNNREQIFPCTHIQVDRWEDRIQVEIQPGTKIIEIPRDGQVIYVMNERGDTIDSYPWPPKSKVTKEFRANA